MYTILLVLKGSEQRLFLCKRKIFSYIPNMSLKVLFEKCFVNLKSYHLNYQEGLENRMRALALPAVSKWSENTIGLFVDESQKVACVF